MKVNDQHLWSVQNNKQISQAHSQSINWAWWWIEKTDNNESTLCNRRETRVLWKAWEWDWLLFRTWASWLRREKLQEYFTQCEPWAESVWGRLKQSFSHSSEDFFFTNGPRLNNEWGNLLFVIVAILTKSFTIARTGVNHGRLFVLRLQEMVIKSRRWTSTGFDPPTPTTTRPTVGV